MNGLFERYLNCPDCKRIEFYCSKHRKEVEQNIHNINGELNRILFG